MRLASPIFYIFLLVGLLGLMVGGDVAQVLAESDTSRTSFGGEITKASFLQERTRFYSLVMRVVSFLLIALSSVRFLTGVEAYFFSRFRGLSEEIIETRNEARTKISELDFEYVHVPPQSRSYFRDSLIGFEDFARLKGYSSKVSITSDSDARIGIKFDIESREIEAGRSTVQVDIEDYVNRLFEESDFTDLPVVITAKHHAKLSKSIQKRMGILKLELENKHITEKQAIYQDMVSSVLSLRSSVIEALPPSTLIPKIEIHNHNIGSQDMTTKITAKNSPGAILANKSKIRTGDIKIDLNDKEAQNSILADIEDVVSLLAKSDINGREKYMAHLELLREELEGEDEADPGMLAKLLEKVKAMLGIADKGTDLYEKVSALIEKVIG